MTDTNTDTNERSLPEQDAYTPDDVALALFGKEHAFAGGKRVRAYLRTNYTRPIELKGKSWILDPSVARHVFEAFESMRTVEQHVTTDADANG